MKLIEHLQIGILILLAATAALASSASHFRLEFAANADSVSSPTDALGNPLP
jgi:hypothetical protein